MKHERRQLNSYKHDQKCSNRLYKHYRSDSYYVIPVYYTKKIIVHCFENQKNILMLFDLYFGATLHYIQLLSLLLSQQFN